MPGYGRRRMALPYPIPTHTRGPVSQDGCVVASTDINHGSLTNLAQVSMNLELEAESSVKQYTYRCCVCNKAVTTARIRTCRNPTCLQSFCSTWCGVLHNRSNCPTAKEVAARSDTIRRQIEHERVGREQSPAHWGKEVDRRDRVHRSRSGLRSTTLHTVLALHTHSPTPHGDAVIRRGRP